MKAPHLHRLRHAVVPMLVIAGTLFHASAHAQTESQACGPIANGYGPYDYRTADRETLGRVERPHFPPVVEALIQGNRGTLGGDLDYTLRAFPNHHRALLSVMRYGEKMQSPQPRDLRYPVECYFERALRFRPDDTIARMIYAQFLGQHQRTPEAIVQLEKTDADAKDNAFTHYNIGLIYFDLKVYDKALAQAHQAIALGFKRPQLRDKLVAAGKWVDAQHVPASAEPTSSAPTR